MDRIGWMSLFNTLLMSLLVFRGVALIPGPSGWLGIVLIGGALLVGLLTIVILWKSINAYMKGL